MLIKAGVDISRLNREIRRQLPVMAWAFEEETMDELIITSTYEGDHGEGSLHYANDAIDLRRPPDPDSLVKKLKRGLGKGFDVILENNHIHIEYDPKPATK